MGVQGEFFRSLRYPTQEKVAGGEGIAYRASDPGGFGALGSGGGSQSVPARLELS
jgi:hypothetical protein